MSKQIDYADTMARGQAGVTALEAKCQPLSKLITRVIVFLASIVLVASAEYASLSFALHSQYGALSNGQDLAADLAHMQYGIMVVLFLSVVLHDHGSSENAFRGLLRNWRVIPIMAVAAGVGVFVATSIAHATGGDQDTLNLGALAISCGCAFLFTVSILITNEIIGKLIPAFHDLTEGMSQRGEIAHYRQHLKAAEGAHVEAKVSAIEIAAHEQTNALRERVAAEVAGIVDTVAAEARDLAASRKSYGGTVARADEEAPDYADVSSDVLQEHAEKIAAWNYAHFYQLLQKDTNYVS